MRTQTLPALSSPVKTWRTTCDARGDVSSYGACRHRFPVLLDLGGLMENWTIDAQNSVFIVDEEDNLIAICLDETEAPMLAAAPQMLEALKAARIALLEVDTQQSRAALEMVSRALAGLSSWH